MEGKRFHIVAQIAGRQGTQEENETGKRAAIRKARAQVSFGGFGSAASVTMYEDDKRKGLIYQCVRLRRRNGVLYTHTEEL